MANMGGFNVPPLPGMPPSIGWDQPFNYTGAGGGTKYNDLTEKQKQRYDDRKDRQDPDREERKRKRPSDRYQAR